MTETVDMPEFDTVQDILDEANKAPYHTVLEVWQQVLAPAEAERSAHITPQWATRITTSYNGVALYDMVDFRDLYFDKVLEFAGILDDEIATDDECLNLTSPEEDVEHNGHHYLNVLINWQKAFLQWELDWDCMSDTAAVEIAAMSEVHRMFFDQNGFIALLDQIKFEFTDADRDLLADILQEMKDSAKAREV